jgi:hypothetical protein
VLGIGAGHRPHEFKRFGVDIARNLEMTGEFCDILDLPCRTTTGEGSRS